MLGCLPLVHGVEVEAGITDLDKSEESFESTLEATCGQRLATQAMHRVERTTLDRFATVETLYHRFRRFQRLP